MMSVMNCLNSDTNQDKILFSLKEETFRLFIEDVKDYGIFLLDTQGNIITWNKGAHRINGYTADEVLGKNFSLFFCKQDLEDRKPYLMLEQVRKWGRVEEVGWRLRKDGSFYWANMIITAVHDEYGILKGYGIVMRDITNWKEAEERITQALNNEIQALKIREEFIIAAKHEIRTPITVILGYVDLLIKKMDKIESKTGINNALNEIRSNANRVSDLADDLSRIVILEKGEVVPKKEKFNILGLVKNLNDEISALSLEHNLIINGRSCIVEADIEMIKDVLKIFVKNAIHRQVDGGDISINVCKLDSDLVVAIKDKGVEIPLNRQLFIFEPMYEGHPPGSEGYIGAASLKLAIARLIIEMHGGRVWVMSEKNQDTIFSFSLPI